MPEFALFHRLSYRQGQVLVLGVSIIAVLLIALLGMFHVGILANEKTKQVHALDAAAYSGALIQARALNMQAYINIAQVGHQMAMAHLVSLASWAEWATTQARSLGRANPPAWVIATHFGMKHGQAYMSAAKASLLNQLASPNSALAQQYQRHDEIVEKVLAKVSYAIRDNMFDARDRAIHLILERNYPQNQILHDKIQSPSAQSVSQPQRSISPSLRWWIVEDNNSSLVKVFKPIANYRSLLTDVAAVYRFLGERKYVAKSLLPVSARCPLWRHELRRQGSTILNDKGNWQSIDTLSYHALRSNRWIGCYYREYPMGWGWVLGQNGKLPEGMAYAADPPGNFAAEDFWRWVKRVAKWNIFGGDDNPLANSRAVQSRQRWAGGGLRAYVDVNHTQSKQKMSFVLHLYQEEVKGHRLHLQTRAETFFERPYLRQDGREEKANLWHPYWQARLADLSSKAWD